MEAIELIVGVTFLFIGISLVFRQNEWTIFIEHMESKGSRAMLTFGTLNTIAGSAILGFHWIWYGMSTLVTIIGIIFLVRGFMCLTYPNWVMKKLKHRMKHAKNNIRIAALSAILVSGIILHNWWMQSYGWTYFGNQTLDYFDSEEAEVIE